MSEAPDRPVSPHRAASAVDLESVLARISALQAPTAGGGLGPEDLESRRQGLRDAIEECRILGRREGGLAELTGDEAISALAEVFRLASWLGAPELALGLAETVGALAQELGPAHHHTLTIRFHLAGALRSCGQAQAAVEVLEQVVEGTEQLLGDDHPQTLTARHGLASACTAAGHPERAVELYGRMVDDAARLLGPRHPDALSARNNLARARQEAGDLAGALALQEALLRDAQGTLGQAHPYLLAFDRNLAQMRAAMEADGASPGV
ncbi:Tetratricopeptide repeat protein [Actinomyces slackii]|uniref:Tetratricopeptide repeat protein n=1 Tax=Actinomyces slackii TaxID=52774 RepID=A0A448K921_9ACTO|nr:tetratricopeptide repeat protein [Actinomyces slackii]VEG73461.1 Uncharacterised protein [Actinomyces slackii]